MQRKFGKSWRISFSALILLINLLLEPTKAQLGSNRNNNNNNLGNNGPSPTAEVELENPNPNGLKCQSPPLDIGKTFPSGTIITVSCPDDYDLVGTDKSSCDFSGLWSSSGIGYCRWRKVKCDSPEIPTNAFIIDQTMTNGEYLVGNYIQYGCDVGYDLVGNSIVRCGKVHEEPAFPFFRGPNNKGVRGDWSSTIPRCRRNNSPPPTVKTTCNAPATIPENAFIQRKVGDLGNNTFSIGGSITYNCTFCYSVSGVHTITCTPGGLWQPNEQPICILTRFGYYLVDRTLVKCQRGVEWNAQP